MMGRKNRRKKFCRTWITVMLIAGILAVGGCGKKETVRQEKAEKEEAERPRTEKAEPEKEEPEEAAAETDGSSEQPPADTGIRVCIDPGHYSGANVLQMADGSTYCEGDVTLLIAQELQRILKERYGITADLTRNSGTITLGGYSDGVLDNYHLALRGEAAAGYDMFLSVHTNANNEGANGYPTCEQPVSINKSIVFVNGTAKQRPEFLQMANAIGTRLTAVQNELGIAEQQFQTVDGAEVLTEWTDAYNDSLNTRGTVCVRTKESGDDYYGVLRGASSVGVPGMIVEHGFHTVPEVRTQIAAGELITRWAEADAAGIAEGFGVD